MKKLIAIFLLLIMSISYGVVTSVTDGDADIQQKVVGESHQLNVKIGKIIDIQENLADATAVGAFTTLGATGAVDFDSTLNVDGTLTQTGVATFVAGIMDTPTALVAADAVIAIPAGTSMIVPSSLTANAWFILPAPVPGQVITLLEDIGPAGYEIRPATPEHYINAVSCTPSKELAVAVQTIVRLTCISSTGWIAEKVSTAGAMATAGTPD